MLGIIIGAVSSIVLLCFFTKDDQAVRDFKAQQKKEREKQKTEAEAQLKKQNDPQLIKKKQASKEAMKEKIFKSLSEAQKKQIDAYLNEERRAGKNDEELLNDAAKKAGIFILVTILLLVVIVWASIVASGVDLNPIKQKAWNMVGFLYPRIKDIPVSPEQL